MSNQAIVMTEYRRGGARPLLNYMEKDGPHPVPLRDRTGRELTDDERAAFVTKSERHQFERSFVIAPENRNDMSREEFDRATRRTVNEEIAGPDAPNTSAVYAVHEREGHRHAHVAATGPERELTVYDDDLERLRETTAEHYAERDRDRDREHVEEHEQDRPHTRDRGPEVGR